MRVRATGDRLEFTPLRFTAEELAGLLGQGRERDSAQSCQDNGADVQNAQSGDELTKQAENALIDLVSPVLGEF